ncbi:MAG: GSCFA domain-containing protein [Bacteroidales bacterium]
MTTFRSEVFPDPYPFKLGYPDKILLLGSCFAENIGNKLIELKFDILSNPLGIIYNPASVAQSLNFLLSGNPFTENDLEFHNEKWISFNHHGRFSSEYREEVLTNINNEIEKGFIYLKNAGYLFLTFGTSRVYKYKKNSRIVANCHKLPPEVFEYYSLTVNDILDLYFTLLEKIHALNPKLKVIFTVSPVRHWKDGATENQYSKAVLIVAIREIVNNFKFVSYFPSYELMMDDLRDYRFYDADLFHPNQIAIDYIWQKFKSTFICDKAIVISEKIEKLTKSVQHRVFYPRTEAYMKFLKSNLSIIDDLQKNYPNLDFSNEKIHFNNEVLKYFGKI